MPAKNLCCMTSFASSGPPPNLQKENPRTDKQMATFLVTLNASSKNSFQGSVKTHTQNYTFTNLDFPCHTVLSSCLYFFSLDQVIKRTAFLLTSWQVNNYCHYVTTKHLCQGNFSKHNLIHTVPINILVS